MLVLEIAASAFFDYGKLADAGTPALVCDQATLCAAEQPASASVAKVTVAILVVLSLLAFGWSAWHAFLAVPLAAAGVRYYDLMLPRIVGEAADVGEAEESWATARSSPQTASSRMMR